MPRKHPEPVATVEVPVYHARSELEPILSVSGVGDYFGVSKGLAAKWVRESPDFPEVFARPGSGSVYLTAEVISWGERHERPRAGGPREAGDPRPPSVRKTSRRHRTKAAA
jgi:hypothetical protein